MKVHINVSPLDVFLNPAAILTEKDPANCMNLVRL